MTGSDGEPLQLFFLCRPGQMTFSLGEGIHIESMLLCNTNFAMDE